MKNINLLDSGDAGSEAAGAPNFSRIFLCCACDRHWEDHETSFETTSMRKDAGLPYGEAYLPFHEFPELRDVVLTGREYDDSQYQALTSGAYAIPDSSPTDLALRLRGASPQGDTLQVVRHTCQTQTNTIRVIKHIMQLVTYKRDISRLGSLKYTAHNLSKLFRTLDF